ncbi:hypothetical protein [Serinicoccus sediminis]|uniref:hypothetical protein n=1 Tax=Serinicoccus sediminis TaxID=2306021 RepID=UPI00192E2874|nr:hypothetical protein [Serinicoccus sediminis]
MQSTALGVLAARGRIDFDTLVMANVGDDSEDPRTLDYVRDVFTPYARDHGLTVHVLDRTKRDGTVETLWGRLMREGSRSLPIPVRMDNGAPGTRSCTSDFKIKVTGKWAKQQGAHGGRSCDEHAVPAVCSRHQRGQAKRPCRLHPADGCPDCTPANLATVAIGISRDEIMRANNRRHEPHEQIVYPLVGIGEETGLSLSRQECMNLIRDEGLPVPPKSSCFFCPFHRPQAWVELRRERPDLFDRSVQLERTLNKRREELGKDPVWLTRFAMPLDEAIAEPDALLPMFDEQSGQCDSGWCWT